MAIRTRLISFIWGFSEATFFFFVPDIWLSRIVLEDKKEAYINIAFATFGALFGGSVLYFLVLSHFENVQSFLDLIPGISDTMVEQTGNQVKELGLWSALLTGIVSGVPYKIYASWSGYLSLSFITFLMASACVRALRFMVVTVVTHVVSLMFQNRLGINQLYWLHAACWSVFYILYFLRFRF